ncbi:MAG: RNA polymerase sigma factor [Rhodothermales bacterium]
MQPFPGELLTIMRLVVPDPSPLDAESDADLLLFAIAGDETERRLATMAFFRRYVREVYRFCWQFQYTLGGETGVCDLVIMTFQHAFEHADTFNDKGILDQKHSRARTFRWLATMSTNLMRDWLKSVSEDHPLPFTSITSRDRQLDGRFTGEDEEASPRRYARLPDDADEVFHDPTAGREIVDNDDDSPPAKSPESKCLQEALAILTDQEREVVLLSAQYSIDGKQLRLPSDVLDGLCKRLETTKMNIRTIRKRARAKIKEYVAMHCKSCP